MQVSKKKINKNLEKEIRNLFCQLMADLRDPSQVEQFLKDFLTETELDVICRRLATAYYLKKGRSYQNIKDNLTVSSATISAIAEQIKSKKGYKIALEKIQAEEWADKWTKKLTSIMKFKRK